MAPRSFLGTPARLPGNEAQVRCDEMDGGAHHDFLETLVGQIDVLSRIPVIQAAAAANARYLLQFLR